MHLPIHRLLLFIVLCASFVSIRICHAQEAKDRDGSQRLSSTETAEALAALDQELRKQVQALGRDHPKTKSLQTILYRLTMAAVEDGYLSTEMLKTRPSEIENTLELTLLDLERQYQDAELHAKKIAESLVKQPLAADPRRHQELAQELSSIVRGAFETRLKIQRAQLEDAQKRLDDTRSRLDRREGQADRIVEGRVNKLLLETKAAHGATDTSPVQHPEDVTDSLTVPEEWQDSLKPTRDLSQFMDSKGDVELNSDRAQTIGFAMGLTFAKELHKDGMGIQNVLSDGPAERAGLKPGDILFGIDRWRISNSRDLNFILHSFETGKLSSPLRIYFKRDGEMFYGALPMPESILDSQQKVHRIFAEALESLTSESNQAVAELLELQKNPNELPTQDLDAAILGLQKKLERNQELTDSLRRKQTALLQPVFKRRIGN